MFPFVELLAMEIQLLHTDLMSFILGIEMAAVALYDE